jgi:hypothetical protein
MFSAFVNNAENRLWRLGLKVRSIVRVSAWEKHISDGMTNGNRKTGKPKRAKPVFFDRAVSQWESEIKSGNG